MNAFFRFFIVVLAVLVAAELLAQTQSNFLDQRISLPKSSCTVAQVLKQIEQAVGCTFSYAGGVIEPDKSIVIFADNKSVREILFQMFGPAIQCTQRKSFVVLSKSKPSLSTAAGYVQDKQGKPIENATVYDPIRLQTARTNDYGYFEIKIKADSIPPLVVSKSGLRDTLLALSSNGGALQYITLAQSDTTWLDKARQWPDSVRLKAWQWGQWANRKIDAIAEIQNVRDSLSRGGQVSFLPMLGTNGRLSGNVSNAWSLNVIGGINGGVRMAEVGGVFNINRSNVRYFQCAGVFNAVDGAVYGMQTAGVLNLNIENTVGMQTAGVININKGHTTGLQVAGVANLNSEGIVGLSVAGIYNRCADTLRGCQVAGLVNWAQQVHGAQIGGVYNRAAVVKGVQVGLINRADSVVGVSVGLISIVKSGYNQWATYYDELRYAGVQWRTGTHFFYTLFDVACRVQPVHAVTHFSYGYGLGVSTNNRKPWVWNNDFTLHHYLPGKWVPSSEFIGKWYSGVERRLGRIVTLTAGATANFNFFKWNSATLEIPFPEADFLWKKFSADSWNYRAWMGWRVGLRFNLNPKPRRS